MASVYRRRRVQVFAAVYLGYAMFYVVRKNISVAMPALMTALSLSRTEMGIVLSLFDTTYAVTKVVNGPLCDRANPRYFMALGLLGAAVANVFFGLSGAVWFFAVLWVFNGFFQSMGSPIGPKVVSAWFGKRERGRIYGAWNTCHNMGAAVAVAGGGYLVAHLGWRAGFIIPGLLAIPGALLVAWYLLDRPQSIGLPPADEPEGGQLPGTAAPTERPGMSAWVEDVLLNWRLWGLAGTSMLIYMIRNGLANWGVTYLTEVKHLSLIEAGVTSSVFEWMGVPGAIVAGFVADRFCAGRSVAVAPAFLLGATAAVLGILFFPSGQHWLDVAGFGLCGFCVYGAQMLCTGLAVIDLVPSRSVAAAVGLTGALSYGGSVITSTLTAFLADRIGWHAAFYYWAACGFCACCLVLPLALGKRRPEELGSSA